MAEAPDIPIVNFRAPSADLDRDLANIAQKVQQTTAKLANTPPIPVAKDLTVPTTALGKQTPGQIAQIQRAAEQAYRDANYASGFSAPIPAAARAFVGTPGGFRDGNAGPGVGGNVGRQIGGVYDLLDRLGTTQGPDAIQERFRRFVGGAGIAFGASQLATAGLNSFGALEARGRDEGRGDLDAVVKSNEQIKQAVERVPIVGGLAVAIRDNILDRGDRSAIDQTAFDTQRLERRADYARLRGDRLASVQQGARSLAIGLEGGVERSDEESRSRGIGLQQRQLDEFLRQSDPGALNTPAAREFVGRARQAIADQLRDAAIASERSARDQSFVGLGLSATLRGDTDAARRLATQREVEAESQAAYRQSRTAGERYDRDIGPLRERLAERDIGNQRLGEATDTQQTIFQSQDRVRELRLRAENATNEAELEAFKRSWDRRVEVARAAVETESDVIKKAQKGRIADQLEEERKAATEAFKIRQERESANTRIASQATVRSLALRQQGKTGEASDAEFEEGYRRQIEGTTDSTRRAQLERERDAARAERAASRTRDTERLRTGNRVGELRLSGRNGEAASLAIESDLRTRLAEASNDPERQQALRQQAIIQSKEALQQILARGPQLAALVSDPTRTDFSRSAAGRGTEALEGLVKQLIEEVKKGNRSPPTAVYSK